MGLDLSKWKPTTPGAKALVAILAGYTLLFFWLACRKFEACNTQQGDLTIWEHMYYQTLRGKLLWCFHTGNSYMEIHAEPLLLFFVPFYALVPSIKTLFFIQTACIALASVPVFLIARKLYQSEATGVLMAVAFIFYAPLVSQNVNQVHDSVFPIPFIMFAFWFFYQEKFWPYLVLLTLACLGKEMTPITAGVFGLYALWKRRSLKWVLTSFAVPAGALILSLGIIRPAYGQGESYIMLDYFPGLGKSLPEFAKTLLTRWDLIFQALVTGENGFYLLMLLTGMAIFVPFLAPEVLFAAPELFFNLLSSNNGMKVVAWHYQTNAGAFLVLGAVFGLARLQAWCTKRIGPGNYTPVMAAGLAALCLSTWWQWLVPGEYKLQPIHEIRQRAFKLLPKGDSLVAGPGQILAHVAQQEVLADNKMILKAPEQMFLYNWVFFDMNFQTPVRGLHVPRELLMAYGTNSLYEVVFAESNIFIMRRKEPYPPSKIPPIRYLRDE
jgi:uncharacterized membrane protein